RCAPLHDRQAATTPALAVAADEPVGTSGAAPGPDATVPDLYSATFGIASDGVKQVIVRADDGTHEALVGGSAFLYVADHPSAGTRVRSVEAVAGDGSRLALSFESAPYGMFDLAPPPIGTLHGPSQIERHLDGGTIGWLQQLQPRGEPLPADLLARVAPMISRMVPPTRPAPNTYPQQPLQQLLVRELQPDPNDFTRVVLAAVSPSGTMNDPDAGVCYE